MNDIKVFVTVEVEKDDDEALITDIFNFAISFNKRLREKYNVPSQLKFTDLPRRYKKTDFQKASELEDIEKGGD